MNNHQQYYLDEHMVVINFEGSTSYYKGDDSYTQDPDKAARDLTWSAAVKVKAQFDDGIATIFTTTIDGEPV